MLATGLAVWVLAMAPASVRGAVLNFDPPQNVSGTTATRLGVVSFSKAVEIFSPVNVATASGTQALRTAGPCDDRRCPNGMYTVTMTFDDVMSKVSMRVGTDESTVERCFPEGPEACELNIRAIAFDAQGAAVADSRDVHVSLNDTFRAALTTPVSVQTASPRIKSVTVSFGADLFGEHSLNAVVRAQLDDLEFTSAGGPPAPTAPPTVVVDTPVQNQYIDRYDAVRLSGRVTAPAGVFAFCWRVNEPPVPPATQCKEARRLGSDNRFVQIAVDDVRLVEGVNTVSVYVWDLEGRVASATVAVELPKREIDVRVIGMEVSQGVQTADLYRDDGDREIAYAGIPLVQLKKTVVRVYANRMGQGPTQDVRMRLWVIARDTLPFTLNLDPENGPRDLVRGDESVTTAMRAGANTAYTFSFDMLRAPRVELLAELVTKESRCTSDGKCFQYTTLLECPTCAANNTLRVTGIASRYLQPLTFSPVKIVWTDAAGKEHGPPSDPRDAFFRPVGDKAPFPIKPPGFGDVSPQPASRIAVLPYAAEVDVTDLKNRLDAGSITDDQLESDTLGRVAGVETANLPGLTIGLSEGLPIGLEKPFFFLWPPIPDPPFIAPRFEPVAVADLGDQPLTSVAHEIFHELGYYHAGLGCNSGVVSISWPPDEHGEATGAFLDTREGSGGVTGTYRPLVRGMNNIPSTLYDLMSYCAHGDSDAWVSLRNWNAFGSTFPNGIIPDPVYLGDTDVVITQHRAPTARLSASVDDQHHASQIAVAQGQGAGTVQGRASRYQFITQTSGGVRRQYLGVVTMGADHGERTISAEVPMTGVRAVTLTEDAIALSARQASASTPRVRSIEIDRGARGSAAGDLVRWTATDADGDPLVATVEYSVDGGRRYRPIADVVTQSRLRLPARLLAHSQRARVRVTVSDGFRRAAAQSSIFTASGGPPTVRITTPAAATRVRADMPISLAGEAWDDRFDALTGRGLTWRDGTRVIGHGTAVAYLARPGRHVLSLEARDARGHASRAEVRTTVLAVTPILTDVAPVRQPTSRDRTLRLRVRASVRATLRVRGHRFRVGPEPSVLKVPIRRSCRPLRLGLVVRASGLSSRSSVVAERRCLRVRSRSDAR